MLRCQTEQPDSSVKHQPYLFWNFSIFSLMLGFRSERHVNIAVLLLKQVRDVTITLDSMLFIQPKETLNVAQILIIYTRNSHDMKYECKKTFMRE